MSHLIAAYCLVAVALIAYVARMAVQRWQLGCRYSQLIQLLESPATQASHEPLRSRQVA